MKKILIYIILCLFILHCPALAQNKILTDAQKHEINTFGNAIEHLIYKKQNNKACLLAYEMIQRYPKEPDSYFIYGKASFHAGYPERAIEYYQKCIQLDKTYYQAFFNIGLIKHQQKKYKEAVKYYTKVIHMTAKNDKYVQANAMAYSNRALAKYYDKKLNNALKDYNKSLSIMSEYNGVDHVYYNRGLCKYDLGDKSGADEDFNTAKILNPKFKYVYYDKR